ncbi:MAG: hypothetical protein K2X86_07680 [Cytophagaceae bacterium]|nr:hypothetical protein [Cytophagaceae bacterium]
MLKKISLKRLVVLQVNALAACCCNAGFILNVSLVDFIKIEVIPVVSSLLSF